MDIGEKLKTARGRFGLTQEQVAEKLFVSRQTISNWETGRSYPDIISVLKLSDLYSISLDELLKGDKKMLEHFEESTNVVKSNHKLAAAVVANIILLLVLLIIAGFVPDNAYFIASVFSLAAIGAASLLYQIVKRL